jgi:hypothetical protein
VRILAAAIQMTPAQGDENEGPDQDYEHIDATGPYI